MAYYVNFIRIFFVFVLFNYSFLIARAYMWTNNGEDWGDRNNWGPPQQCVVGLPCYPHQRGDLAYFNVSTSALEVAVNVNGSFNLSNMVFDESRSDHTKYRIYPEASSLCNLIFRTNVDLPPGSTISNSYLKSAFSGNVDISCPLIMSNFENATDDSPNSLVIDCSKPDARINILGTLSQEYFVSPYLDLGLVKVGPGTLYLANNANNFKRGVRILNGQITAQTILDSGFECSLGYGSAILLSINGAYSFDPLNLNPAFYNYPLSVAAASKLMIHSLSEQQTNRNIFLSGAGMLGNLSTDHKVVFTGSINNLSNAFPASLVIQGPGIVELRGENIYSGTTVVDMGSILFTRRASPSSLPPIPEASNVVIRNGVFDPTCGGNSVDSYRFKSLTQYGGEFTLIDQIDLGQVGDENISARTTFKSTTYNDFFPTVFFTYYSTFDSPFFPFNARISTEGLMDITSAELIVYFLEDDPAPSSKVFTILQARDFIRPLPSLIKSNYNKNAHGGQQFWYQYVQKSDKVELQLYFPGVSGSSVNQQAQYFYTSGFGPGNEIPGLDFGSSNFCNFSAFNGDFSIGLDTPIFLGSLSFNGLGINTSAIYDTPRLANFQEAEVGNYSLEATDPMNTITVKTNTESDWACWNVYAGNNNLDAHILLKDNLSITTNSNSSLTLAKEKNLIEEQNSSYTLTIGGPGPFINLGYIDVSNLFSNGVLVNQARVLCYNFTQNSYATYVPQVINLFPGIDAETVTLAGKLIIEAPSNISVEKVTLIQALNDITTQFDSIEYRINPDLIFTNTSNLDKKLGFHLLNEHASNNVPYHVVYNQNSVDVYFTDIFGPTGSMPTGGIISSLLTLTNETNIRLVKKITSLQDRLNFTNSGSDVAFHVCQDEIIAQGMTNLSKKQAQLTDKIVDEANPVRVYALATASFGNVDTKHSQIGMGYNTVGFLVGFDYAFEQVGVGVEFDYTRFNSEVYQHWGSYDVDQVHGSVYSTYVPKSRKEIALNAILGFGYNFSDIERNTGASIFPLIAKADHNSLVFDALLGIEVNPFVSNNKKGYRFIPYLNGQYMYFNQEKYKESHAGVLDLSYANVVINSLRSQLGFKIDHITQKGSWTIKPQFNLAWQYEYLQNGQNQIVYALAFDGLSAMNKIVAQAANTLLAGFNILAKLSDVYEFEINYDLEWNNLIFDNSFYLGFGFDF